MLVINDNKDACIIKRSLPFDICLIYTEIGKLIINKCVVIQQFSVGTKTGKYNV